MSIQCIVEHCRQKMSEVQRQESRPFDRRHYATARCILAPWQPIHLSHSGDVRPLGLLSFWNHPNDIYNNLHHSATCFFLMSRLWYLGFAIPWEPCWATPKFRSPSHIFSHGSCPFSALLPSSLKHTVSYNCNTVVIMSCFLTRYSCHMISYDIDTDTALDFCLIVCNLYIYIYRYTNHCYT